MLTITPGFVPSFFLLKTAAGAVLAQGALDLCERTKWELETLAAAWPGSDPEDICRARANGWRTADLTPRMLVNDGMRYAGDAPGQCATAMSWDEARKRSDPNDHTFCRECGDGIRAVVRFGGCSLCGLEGQGT